MDAIVDILKEKIGLNPSSIGESSIRRAVTHCMSMHNIPTVGVYSQLIQNSATELKRLIEEIVVKETWFFRNAQQFKALESHVIRELMPKSTALQPFRILSVPCSTGEEPYSIAITLREAGVPQELYEINAIDISQNSINTALDANYSKNSFREVDNIVINNYFFGSGNNYQLVSLIRNRVNFLLGNLLADNLEQNYYDVIFCRNLLIYFDRKNQQRVLNKLYASLKKDGILFVGHAEATQVPTTHYEQLPDHHTFAFKKRNVVADEFDLTQTSPNTSGQWEDVFEKISKIPKLDEINYTAVHHRPRNKKPMLRSLIPAEKLAHQGNYIEASGLCNEYLQHIPDSAQANYLLGLIKNYQGKDKEAEKWLKKAIYLDPNHEPALSLSLALAEKRGDVDAVKSFTRRVNRVRNRKPTV